VTDVKNTLRNVLIKKGFLYQNTLMKSMPNEHFLQWWGKKKIDGDLLYAQET